MNKYQRLFNKMMVKKWRRLYLRHYAGKFTFQEFYKMMERSSFKNLDLKEEDYGKTKSI